MFLLIPEFSRMSRKPGIFTFQYVSINTVALLIDAMLREFFTFQYVSINTDSHWKKSSESFPFTFQYVSINTFF